MHCFEALPTHFELSRKNTAHLNKVFMSHTALFDKIGTLTFYYSQKVPAASSLLQDNLDHIEIPTSITYDGINYCDREITVPCTTIDQWAQEHNVKNIDYIWLDTEGAELYILQNAKTILPSVKVISIEANFQEFRKGMTLFSDLYNFLIDQGFILKCIWGNCEWQATAVFINPANCSAS